VFHTEALKKMGHPPLQCRVLAASTEADCSKEERASAAFFSDQSSMNRIKDCPNYFDKISTVAFEKVDQLVKSIFALIGDQLDHLDEIEILT